MKYTKEIAREIATIASALGGHDRDFTMPLYQRTVDVLAAYFGNRIQRSTLLWHLRRIRGRAMRHDAAEAGEVA